MRRYRYMKLHPTLVDLQEKVRAAGTPEISECTPDQARRLLAASAVALGAGPDVFSTADLSIPTTDGSIGARLYRSGTVECGLIVYVHGGGWVIGGMDDFDALARMLCRQSGCALLLLDYRLAPEYPFPHGLNDITDALMWAHSNIQDLAGTRVPLVVAGDSAGGNLATVALARLQKTVPVALQVLIYPVTDCVFGSTSYEQFGGGGYLLTRRDMQWFFGHYASGSTWQDPEISPMRRHDLTEMPSTWIALAQCDVLYDEGKNYAEKLKADGVEVQVTVYQGMAHGFIRMANVVDVAKQAVDDAASAIKAACKVYAVIS